MQDFGEVVINTVKFYADYVYPMADRNIPWIVGWQPKLN